MPLIVVETEPITIGSFECEVEVITISSEDFETAPITVQTGDKVDSPNLSESEDWQYEFNMIFPPNYNE